METLLQKNQERKVSSNEIHEMNAGLGDQLMNKLQLEPEESKVSDIRNSEIDAKSGEISLRCVTIIELLG